MKEYHKGRDCQNGKFFYNSCGGAMHNDIKPYPIQINEFVEYYPMPQELSQFKQVKQLQKEMHNIHEKYVVNKR